MVRNIFPGSFPIFTDTIAIDSPIFDTIELDNKKKIHGHVSQKGCFAEHTCMRLCSSQYTHDVISTSIRHLYDVSNDEMTSYVCFYMLKLNSGTASFI